MLSRTIHADGSFVSIYHSQWFTWVCKNEGVEPIPTFRAEVQENFRGKLKGPFNETDRMSAVSRSFHYALLDNVSLLICYSP